MSWKNYWYDQSIFLKDSRCIDCENDHHRFKNCKWRTFEKWIIKQIEKTVTQINQNPVDVWSHNQNYPKESHTFQSKCLSDNESNHAISKSNPLSTGPLLTFQI